MTRRPAALVALAVLVFLMALPLAGEAQRPVGMARIGYLSPLSASADSVQARPFRQGLADLGYVEGQNIVIEARYADGKYERLPGLAAELVRLNVDVIVASPTPAVRAAHEATRTIPIVTALSGDPVGDRLASSLARPGGNVTGLSGTAAEITGKRVDLLKTLVPGLSRVAHLSSPEATSSVRTAMEAAGRTLGVQVTTLLVRDSNDLNRALSTLRDARVGGLVVALTLREHWRPIIDFAQKRRLPTVSGPRGFVEAGGLMAFGPDYSDLSRKAASYVDKILKGAKPADLPIEQPTKFELVINRRTAKALALTIPPSLLLQASHVID